jgi:hypothetical protein
MAEASIAEDLWGMEGQAGGGKVRFSQVFRQRRWLLAGAGAMALFQPCGRSFHQDGLELVLTSWWISSVVLVAFSQVVTQSSVVGQ